MLSCGDLARVLQGVLAPQNDVRATAEAALVALKNDAGLIPALLEQLKSNPAPEVRHCATIILKKRLVATWAQLDEAAQASAKQGLMQAALAGVCNSLNVEPPISLF